MGIKRKEGQKGSKIIPTIDKFPDDRFNYPVFCFKHIHPKYSFDNCTKDELVSCIHQLHKLSQLTWMQIRGSHRHGMGSEKIEQNSIKTALPDFITPDITLLALRFDGKKPMVGYKSHFVFHVIFLDRDFTLYDH